MPEQPVFWTYRQLLEKVSPAWNSIEANPPTVKIPRTTDYIKKRRWRQRRRHMRPDNNGWPSQQSWWGFRRGTRRPIRHRKIATRSATHELMNARNQLVHSNRSMLWASDSSRCSAICVHTGFPLASLPPATPATPGSIYIVVDRLLLNYTPSLNTHCHPLFRFCRTWDRTLKLVLSRLPQIKTLDPKVIYILQ